MRRVRDLLAGEAGQNIAEYAIALAIIGLGAGLAAVAIATDVGAIWEACQAAIEAVLG